MGRSTAKLGKASCTTPCASAELSLFAPPCPISRICERSLEMGSCRSFIPTKSWCDSRKKVKESRRMMEELSPFSAAIRNAIKNRAKFGKKELNVSFDERPLVNLRASIIKRREPNSDVRTHKQKTVTHNRYNNRDEVLSSLEKSREFAAARSPIVRKKLSILLKNNAKRQNELNLSIEQQEVWNKLMPYYRYCNSCQFRNYRYGSLLFERDDETKKPMVDWNKLVEKEKF
eukprot:TRINITY_DN3380_c0_g1_i2.p1 TRINITY_DN3380_c0_g1~~TRINITY_DN3380_c0_g1_i2.p1  ORF type:complete len:231 (-),score=16.80 TRINITY_DN3380_c0_g1_i2:64-756(-)